MATVLEPEEIVVGHDEHPAHAALAPANQSLLQKYILSTDHKQVGINYMVTALIFFFVGGILAELMRVNLATPGSKFVSATTYNEFYTMHGTIMVFLFA